MEVCTAMDPVMLQAGKDHWVRCHLYTENMAQGATQHG
jgi:hypothetical protein